MLVIIGEGGTIAYRNEVILALNNDPMPVWLGWTLAVVGLAAYAGLTWRTDHRRRKARPGEPARAAVGHQDRRRWSIFVLAVRRRTCRWSAAPTRR